MHMHIIAKVFRCIVLVALVAMDGCAAVQTDIDTRSNADPTVRIQICLPTKRIYFNNIELAQLENHPQVTHYSPQQLELAPKTVRRVAGSSESNALHTLGIGFGEVLLRSSGYSYGSSFMPLRDSTVADQPVFEQGYGYPARAYIAMSVRVPEPDQGPE
jgi:hypothetical protein